MVQRAAPDGLELRDAGGESRADGGIDLELLARHLLLAQDGRRELRRAVHALSDERREKLLGLSDADEKIGANRAQLRAQIGDRLEQELGAKGPRLW